MSANQVTRSRRVPRLTLAAFSVAVVLGGANFVAVRLSNQELAPFWGAGLRFGLAAVLFVIIALVLRLPWPRGRLLAITAVYGALAFAIPYALMYWALTQATAGTATVVMAGVPLVTLLLAVTQRLERFTMRSVGGSVLAIGGVVWMVLGSQGVGAPVGAVLAMLVATVVIGQSIIMGKRLSANHPAMTNAVAMLFAAPLLIVLSAMAGEAWVLPGQPDVVVALAYLVTLGSVGLFVLVLLVVRTWTSSATSYMFVLFPLVTLGLAAWLIDEPLTLPAVLGAALVMTGVWFGALSGTKAGISD
ncbi:EamA family transporter [Arthrobacter sp.]|uniref:DMT family transporter n=1 Tax=Arthrobacter sp. TaxID=1667 RepID=UPI002811406E|nr:EamA family transporter [Arthrobacter sp.]